MDQTTRINHFLLLVVTYLAILLPSVSASPSDHRYNVGDDVPLFVNKVGSLNNPSETYQYYHLPFCHPDQVIRKTETLGEVLNGDRLTNALYKLKFREDKIGDILCQKELKREQVTKFRNAIMNDFYFQMYYDDLPFWGFIGKVEEANWTLDEKGLKFYIFSHVRFDALYNDDHIIEIHAFSDPDHVVELKEDVETNVEFTYSVFWNATSTEFENRMNSYSRASFLPIQQKIHWFSLFNSAVILLLLIGLFMVFSMRNLKTDLRKCYAADEEEGMEVGWKYIQNDVFGSPSHMPLLCAVLGSGTQLLMMVCLLFVLVFVGVLYPYNRGALTTALVVIYTLTSAVAGYSASSSYCQFAEIGWEKCVLLTGILYLGPVFSIIFILNTVAIGFGATAAIPFGMMVVVCLIYAFLTSPLLAFGGVFGYRIRARFRAPSATKRCPREIPSLAWYWKTPAQMFLGGLLPFSAIILELHHLYASMWGYKIYILPSILLINFIILIILTALLSVGLTYFQLTVEDHEWWWRSVLRGGSTAIFMFVHCIYFYAKSNMSGFMQLSFFFGYNACLCYAVFLMLGTISFRASLVFVHHIYFAVKNE
ncbi:unnamed protein product [Ilex paraguariensis]|uniref:Transmembrane 9 superfamily member n=1 Tax=Ilex paraguariensis TaxID=185542 RepID=A0ABC8TPG4_9AQUA